MTAEALRWAGGVGIVAIAVIRCVITFAPQVVFDVDPAIDPSPLPGLGPAGSLWLDTLLLAACGCALLGETLTRRGIDWRLLALALAPVPVVLGHGLGDLGDLWRGSTWAAAATACAVIAHLARDRSMRIVLVALLVALLVPIAVRGATQVSLSAFGLSWAGPEYTETVAEFEAGRDAYFADRGWAPDSPAALIYERRLRQADPRGWFATANVFASMMAAGTVMLVGLTIGAVRGRLGRGWCALLGVAAAAAGATVLVAGSKGAIASAAAGGALLIAPLAGRRAAAFLGRFGGATAVALVGMALLAVVARGVVLPESWLGEKSLLFRWHYLVGSARVIAEHGVVGVGPDGFQAAYTSVRLPRSPEEVTSAHNMFADWLSTLGLVGAAWTALVLVLIWRAGRRSSPLEPAEPSDAAQAHALGRVTLLVAAAVALAGLTPALLIEAPRMGNVSIQIGRTVGMLGYVAAAATLAMVMRRLPPAMVDWSLTAAAIVLVFSIP